MGAELNPVPPGQPTGETSVEPPISYVLVRKVVEGYREWVKAGRPKKAREECQDS